MTQQPTLLPLLSTGPHGSRSHMTCQFRCGNACSKPIPNETDNPEFHEVAAQALARRSVLKAAGAGVGALAIGALTAPPAAAAPAVAARRSGGNAVPVSGPRRGHVEQFLTMPTGAETCGPLISEDQRSVFVAVQHPGETNGATFENPGSTWPHTDDFPRPGVVVTYRAD